MVSQEMLHARICSIIYLVLSLVSMVMIIWSCARGSGVAVSYGFRKSSVSLQQRLMGLVFISSAVNAIFNLIRWFVTKPSYIFACLFPSISFAVDFWICACLMTTVFYVFRRQFHSYKEPKTYATVCDCLTIMMCVLQSFTFFGSLLKAEECSPHTIQEGSRSPSYWNAVLACMLYITAFVFYLFTLIRLRYRYTIYSRQGGSIPQSAVNIALVLCLVLASFFLRSALLVIFLIDLPMAISFLPTFMLDVFTTFLPHVLVLLLACQWRGTGQEESLYGLHFSAPSDENLDNLGMGEFVVMEEEGGEEEEFEEYNADNFV